MAALKEVPAGDLLDVEEAAGFCHVKASTMRSWILHNRVTYVKLGRRVFLRKPDLDALISGSIVPAKVRNE
jgi:excisionase family DNA binding protein